MMDKVDLIGLIHNIQNETRPVDGHTDPGAIADCFDELRDEVRLLYERLEELKERVPVLPGCGVLVSSLCEKSEKLGGTNAKS